MLQRVDRANKTRNTTPLTGETTSAAMFTALRTGGFVKRRLRRTQKPRNQPPFSPTKLVEF